MKNCLYILLSTLVIISFMFNTSCKEKKEEPMVDIESIDYDGSRDDRYIFRKELEKEQKKKQKLERLQKEME